MEQYVTTEWNGAQYRATYGKCSILEARRYYHYRKELYEWVRQETGDDITAIDIEQAVEDNIDFLTIVDTWLNLCEILACLRSFEKGVENGDNQIVWKVDDFPNEWKRGDTAVETMPYEFWESSLHVSRQLNPGIFPSSPDFLARTNVQIKEYG